MARKKPSTVLDQPPSNCDGDGLDQLTSTVDTLAQEVRVLREAIDELREILEWAMQNREAASDHPFRPVAGLARDTVDKGDDKTIKHTTPKDVSGAEETAATAPPGELF